MDGVRWRASGSLTRQSCDSFVQLVLSADRSEAGNALRILELDELEDIDMQGVQVLAAFVASRPGRCIAGAQGPVLALLERVGAWRRLSEPT